MRGVIMAAPAWSLWVWDGGRAVARIECKRQESYFATLTYVKVVGTSGLNAYDCLRCASPATFR